MMLDRFHDFNEMENDPTADRNREPSEPDNNMNIEEDNNEEGELMEQGVNEGFEEDEYEDEEFGPQEFSALNSQLDQLQSALDSLETRNDDIHSKLLDLLRSSREIRQVMKEENNPPGIKEEDEETNAESNVATSSLRNIGVEKNCTSTSAVENCDDGQNISKAEPN